MKREIQNLSLPERLATEEEKLRNFGDQHAADMRVAAPGIIQAFDIEKQTVTVQLALRERININGNLTWETIPLLVDVPIFMPRAGGYLLTLPIKKGDECLVIFGDCCIDAWYQSGGVQNQLDKRRHDLSDGFAILGIWSQPRKVQGYSPDAMQMKNEEGTACIEIKGTEINIRASKINIFAAGNTVIENRNFVGHNHVRVKTGNDISGGVL